MIVKGSIGIANLATYLRQKVLASISDSQTSSDLQLTAVCIDLISEDFDRAVDILLRDRMELCGIFELAVAHVQSPLADALHSRVCAKVDNFRVQTLTEVSDQDISALIALHEAVEVSKQAKEAWAPEVDARSWRFIEDYAARRAYQSPV